MDPSLSSGKITLPSLVDGDSGSGSGCPAKQAAVVLTEGLPPVSTKLLETIQNREFVELANLFSHETPSGSESLSIIKDGQSMIVRPQHEPASRKRITDLSTWLQAFSIYAATLVASDKNNSAQFKGFMAHMYLMIQLSKDLGGTVWLQYDREFRTWAATKGVKIWEELNLSIYGHCLAAHQRPPSFPKPTPQKRGYDRRDEKKPAKGRQQNCCYKWNFDGSYHKSAAACRYLHACHTCGEDHRVMECPCPASKSLKGF